MATKTWSQSFLSQGQPKLLRISVRLSPDPNKAKPIVITIHPINPKLLKPYKPCKPENSQAGLAVLKGGWLAAVVGSNVFLPAFIAGFGKLLGCPSARPGL